MTKIEKKIEKYLNEKEPNIDLDWAKSAIKKAEKGQIPMDKVKASLRGDIYSADENKITHLGDGYFYLEGDLKSFKIKTPSILGPANGNPFRTIVHVDDIK